MSNPIIKTRIQLKNDIEANWNKIAQFIPLRGELIVYSTDETHPFSRLKIGDGTTPIIDLPFLEAETIGGVAVKAQPENYWNSIPEYIPRTGEIIIYLNHKEIIIDTNKRVSVSGIKIGDGTSYLIDLPFMGDIDYTVKEHITNANIHVSQEDRNLWNNKINCLDNIQNEVLFLNRN